MNELITSYNYTSWLQFAEPQNVAFHGQMGEFSSESIHGRGGGVLIQWQGQSCGLDNTANPTPSGLQPLLLQGGGDLSLERLFHVCPSLAYSPSPGEPYGIPFTSLHIPIIVS